MEEEFSVPVAKIKKVQFDLIDPAWLEKTCTHVTKPSVMQKMPVLSGIHDPHMGPWQRSILCATCKSEFKDCPNHFGVTDLCRPMIHPEFVKAVKTILSCVCYYCSRLLLRCLPEAPVITTQPMERLAELAALSSKISHCSKSKTKVARRRKAVGVEEHQPQAAIALATVKQEEIVDEDFCCGQQQPVYAVEGMNIRAYTRDSGVPVRCDADRIRNILGNISVRDEKYLGFPGTSVDPKYQGFPTSEDSERRLSRLVMTNIPVVPQSIHQTYERFEGDGSWGQDGITNKYRCIIRLNLELKQEQLRNKAWKHMYETQFETKNPNSIYMRHEPDIYRELQTQVCGLISGDGPIIINTKTIPTPNQWEIHEELSAIPEQKRSPEQQKLLDFLTKVLAGEQKKHVPLAKFGRLAIGGGQASVKSVLGSGKQNFARQHMGGKRRDCSARDVVTPEPTLRPTELAVPRILASKLRQMTTVTPWCAHEMTQAVVNGRTLAGAAFIVLNGNTVIDLRAANHTAMLLRNGAVVSAHMRSGTKGNLNRNPSLTANSLRTHDIQVKEDESKSMSFTDSVCTPYNADFDGDEMNLHLPQNEMARAESDQLMHIRDTLKSVRNGKALVSPIQDTPAATWLLSEPGRVFAEAQAQHHIMHCKDADFGSAPQVTMIDHLDMDRNRARPRCYVSGMAMLSTALPKTMNLHKHTGLSKVGQVVQPGSKALWIRNGNLLLGRIGKDKLGALTVYLDKVFGPNVAVDWMYKTTCMCYSALMAMGTTFGLKECTVTSETQRLLKKINQLAVDAMDALDESQSHYERLCYEIGSECKTRIEWLVMKEKEEKTRRGERDDFYLAVASGARAKADNITQMCGGMNQTIIAGQRPAGNLVHTRTMSKSVQRGWIKSSIFEGRSPDEDMPHNQASQNAVGAVERQVPQTGYLARKMAKSMEEAGVAGNGHTVLHSNGIIVQTAFGDDGFDAAFMEPIKLRILTMDNDVLKTTYGTYRPEIKELRWLRDRIRISLLALGHGKLSKLTSPINFVELYQQFEHQFEHHFEQPSSESATTVSPEVAWSKVTAMLLRMERSSALRRGQVFWALVRDYLSTREIVRRGWSPAVLDRVLQVVEDRYNRALIAAHSRVGADSAGRLAEPTTQSSLSARHDTGKDTRLETGVVRVTELIDMTAKIRTPSSQLYIHPRYEQDRAAAEEIAAKIVVHDMRSVSLEHSVLIHSTEMPAEMKARFPTSFGRIADRSPEAKWSPFVLCVKLNRAKSQAPHHVVAKLKRFMTKVFANFSKFDDAKNHPIGWAYSTPADTEWFVYLRFIEFVPLTNYWWRQHFREVGKDRLTKNQQISETWDTPPSNEELRSFYRHVLDRILSCTLSGVTNIRTATVVEKQVTVVDPVSKGLVQRSIFAVETMGSNLKSCFYACPRIDSTRSWTNDVQEMYQTFGADISQIIAEQELSSALDHAVDPRHPKLATRMQHYFGLPLGMTRFGVLQQQDSPISRLAFETPGMVANESALFGRVDELKSIPANLFVGNEMPVGTKKTTICTKNEFPFRLEIEPNLNDVPRLYDIKPIECSTAEEFDLHFGNTLRLWQKAHGTMYINPAFMNSFVRKNDHIVASVEAKQHTKPRNLADLADILVQPLVEGMRGRVPDNVDDGWRPMLFLHS